MQGPVRAKSQRAARRRDCPSDCPRAPDLGTSSAPDNENDGADDLKPSRLTAPGRERPAITGGGGLIVPLFGADVRLCPQTKHEAARIEAGVTGGGWGFEGRMPRRAAGPRSAGRSPRSQLGRRRWRHTASGSPAVGSCVASKEGLGTDPGQSLAAHRSQRRAGGPRWFPQASAIPARPPSRRAPSR